MRIVLALLMLLALIGCEELPAPLPDSYLAVKHGGTKVNGLSTTDIARFGWADTDCYGSIQAAMDRLQPGQQLWIADGTYDGPIHLLDRHAGTPDDWTVVRALNPSKVKLLDDDDYATIRLRATSYVEVLGFEVLENEYFPIYAHEGSHHFKVRFCGFDERNCLSQGSSYGLFENCYAWGGPHRYMFQANKGSNHIVYRRCVGRWDFSDTIDPQAIFANYTCEEIHYQNCISLDGTDNRAQDVDYDGLKSYFTPNGSPSTTYTGCISLNMQGAGGWWCEGPAGKVSLTDCIAWDHRSDVGDATEAYQPWPFMSTANYGGMEANRLTIGVSNIGTHPVEFDPANTERMRNSIIMLHGLDAGEYAVMGDLDDHDYNCYWGNTGGRDKQGGRAPHDVTVDPRQNGLKVLIRIELGSFLKTAGEGGGQIGAEIVYRTGATGTLYGEAGWDSTFGDKAHLLWPWDNEEAIVAACRSFKMEAGEAYPGSPAMNGARGFAAPKMSLTPYVLNYLDKEQ